ncbi:unnamed protein product [Durusdinium trenchii]|uniref:PPPDE domain-containing protein n=1 Tax=Durusdinium trenchii TaxID=1381693 RepID=A0ABP0SVE2_9DINO
MMNAVLAHWLAPVKLGGAFHVGVEVGGLEWSYGRTFRDSRPGVVGMPPRKDPNHSFRQTVHLGYTEMSLESVNLLISVMIEDYPGRSYDVLRCGLASELLFQVEFRPTIVGSRVFAYPVLLKVMREHAQTQRTDEKRSERDEQIRPIDGSEFCRGFSYSLSFLTPRDRHAGSKRRRTSFNAFPWLHRSVAGFSSMAASEERILLTATILDEESLTEENQQGKSNKWLVRGVSAVLVFAAVAALVLLKFTPPAASHVLHPQAFGWDPVVCSGNDAPMSRRLEESFPNHGLPLSS